MAYVIRITSTKPQGTLWYHESGQPGAAAVMARITAWNTSQPGFIEQGTMVVNQNVNNGHITFNSKLNGDTWLAAAQVEPDHVTRDAYLASIGVVQNITLTEE